MNNLARSRKLSRRRGCRRNRYQHGAGLGQTYGFGGSVDPTNPSIGNAARVIPVSSCQTATSPGFLTNVSKSGLPGFAGGSRRRNRKRMNGGTYARGFEVVSPNQIALTTNNYSSCGEARSLQNGGAGGNQLGTIAVDAMVYEAPRSGYSHMPSNSYGGNVGSLADGKTPFLLNVPYSTAGVASGACVKTGGGSRKNRKASRKNRKASRKNRRNSTCSPKSRK